jgi:hypothetical protein
MDARRTWTAALLLALLSAGGVPAYAASPCDALLNQCGSSPDCDQGGCHYCADIGTSEWFADGGFFNLNYQPVTCGDGALTFAIGSSTSNVFGHVSVLSRDGTQCYEGLESSGGGSHSTGPLGFEPGTGTVDIYVPGGVTTDTYHYIFHVVGNRCCGVSCDDGNPCTNDSCNPLTGCAHANNTAPCAADGNPCTLDRCSNGACYRPAPLDGHACDDGNACTTGDHCSAGACVGAPVSCDDGNVCTDDACNPSVGCVHTNNRNACADDGNICTDDVCSGGACTHPPNAAPCDDKNPCTANDRCSNGVCGGTCQTGTKCVHGCDGGWCQMMGNVCGCGSYPPWLPPIIEFATER